MAKDDKKGKKPATPEDIMDVGDLRPLLKVAKGGKPVNAAVGLSDEGDAVILLRKQGSGKNARKALIAKAKEVHLALDERSLRFGRATFDEEDAVLKLVVNKEPSGSALGMKLRKRLQPAGFKNILITADASIENEPEETEDEAPAATAAASARAEPSATPAAAQGAGEPPPAPAAETAQQQAASAAPAAPPAAAEAGAAAPAAAGMDGELKAQLSKHLARIIPQIALLGADRKAALGKQAAAATAAVQGGAADAEQQVQQLATALEDALGQDIAEGAGGAAGGRDDAAKAASKIAKSQAVWRITREAIESKIDALHGKMAEAYKDHGFGADLEKYFKSKVEPVLGQLDDSLIGALDEVGRASEPAERSALCAKAHAIVTRYQGYLAGEDLIKKLDENPFVPNLGIEKTLTASLTTLDKTLATMSAARA